jgi:hypothetical protein
MNNIPTPRTDDAFDAYYRGAAGTAYIRDQMNNLERENTELRQALSGRTVSCSQCNDAAAKMAEMREAIKCADEALEADGYDLENKARAKLQLFIS